MTSPHLRVVPPLVDDSPAEAEAPTPADPPAGTADPPRGGPPSPAERRRVYFEALRSPRPLPVGWQADRAREWGIDHGLVSRELAAARERIAWERSPEGCRVMAHDLTMRADRLSDEIRTLADDPSPTAGTKVRLLKMAADGYLKCAAGLLAIHRGLSEPSASR